MGLGNLDAFYGTNSNIMSLGGNGLRVLLTGETLAANEIGYAILALDNSTIECTLDNPKGDSNISTSLAAGIMLYTTMTSVDVLDGQVVVYLK